VWPPEATISVTLPTQRYRTLKTVVVPFDPVLSHGGKFQSLEEAILFIARHCAFHHKGFTRALAKTYLPFCRILDLVHGNYVVPAQLSKKEFDRAVAIGLRFCATIE
jgi:hypothetical protein